MPTVELPARGRLSALLLLASVGCGDVAKPPVLLVSPPPRVPASRTRDGWFVATHAGSGTPSGFVMDGDVAEWTTLFQTPPRSNEPEELDPNAPRPARNATSHLAVALTPTGAVLAGELGDEALRAVWISLAFHNPQLPTLGHRTNGGGTEEANCQAPGETSRWSNHVLTEDDVRACENALAEGAAFEERWRKRFRRRYLVDESGVRLATRSGLEPVPGVQIAWKASPTGATFEATLPALALPLCGEAPVATLALSAAPSDAETPPPDDPSRSVWHDIEPPIGFEPYADHRAILFYESRTYEYLQGPYAYQPGDPNALERAGYAPQAEFPYADRMRRELFRSELVTKERSFGDLEVGTIEGQGVAVWRGGKLLGTARVDARAWVERDSELFGVSWSQWTDDETWNESASFYAFAIRADGSFREGLIHPVEPFLHWGGVDEVTPSKDLRTLVIRGVASGEPYPPRRTTIATWTYDPKTRDWRPTVRHTPRAPTVP